MLYNAVHSKLIELIRDFECGRSRKAKNKILIRNLLKAARIFEDTRQANDAIDIILSYELKDTWPHLSVSERESHRMLPSIIEKTARMLLKTMITA